MNRIQNHNIETVKRFSHRVRSKATYDRSLKVLRYAKEIEPWSFTKSSVMPGFGETKNEIMETMDDLLAVNVDILTIGQYLPPIKKQALFLPVQKYWHPEKFAELKKIALKKKDLNTMNLSRW